jgi:microsomal dipeptidase-like Zn-dependent dipeptidase
VGKFVRRLLAGAIVAAAVYVFGFLPAQVAGRLNTTLDAPPYDVSPRARDLHQQLLVADLHADTLLWDRDLLSRHEDGHVDVPRLIDGNVALQIFTIVTKAPSNIQLDGNDSASDAITWLMLAQLRPPSTWRSLTARALDQARAFDEAVARSHGRLAAIRSGEDLERHLERRARDRTLAAGLLGIEGAHALDGRLDNLDRLFDAGVRMIGPAHLADSDVAGSAQGVEKGGLTESGRELIRRMEARNVLVDLAHASPKAFDDAIAMATRPVLVSHTGVQGTCDNARNLTDGQLRAVARTGGVVGIGYWETATCGRDAHAVARAIRHAAGVMGIQHVGLGSDFDGTVVEPFDTTGLALITEALADAGFSEGEIRAVMGNNVLRLLRASLP